FRSDYLSWLEVVLKIVVCVKCTINSYFVWKGKRSLLVKGDSRYRKAYIRRLSYQNIPDLYRGCYVLEKDSRLYHDGNTSRLELPLVRRKKQLYISIVDPVLKEGVQTSTRRIVESLCRERIKSNLRLLDRIVN